MHEIIAAIGLGLGMLSFGWHILNASKKYLHIDLTLIVDNARFISALTRVENTGWLRKRIDNALLLIGPESESPIDTFNAISKQSDIGIYAKSTNDIVAHEEDTICSGPKGRLLIPLPFYYSENVAIADERMSYRSPIVSEHLPTGVPYSVRFFLHSSGRLHRSTQDSFIVPNPE